jgi:hypothetical protein
MTISTKETLMSVTTEKPAAATTIRPFRAEVAEEELVSRS